MVPVGWQEMQCPKTYIKEFRKVAKVLPETLNPPVEETVEVIVEEAKKSK